MALAIYPNLFRCKIPLMHSSDDSDCGYCRPQLITDIQDLKLLLIKKKSPAVIVTKEM